MYYPYMRGKQEELLALKELLDNNLLSDSIIPIIEPVSLSSTLVTTLEKFIDKKRKAFIVQNPNVGTFFREMSGLEIKEEYDDEKEKKKVKRLLSYKERYESALTHECIRLGVCIGKKFSSVQVDNMVKDYAIIFHDKDSVMQYNIKNEEKCSICLVPSTEFRKNFNSNLVLFGDRFNRKRDNSEYINQPIEFFSEDHLLYLKNNYNGFSDYSIAGSSFESGFAPSTLVIHIVYFDEESRALNICHFTSDTNNTKKNQAKKFAEAGNKLKNWSNLHTEVNTLGLRELLKDYDEENYRGLGMLKRLSIMHHLELIGQYLKEI